MVRKNSEHLQHNIKAFIRKGEDYYVAECLDIAVVMQGKTLDETIANLKESVALHLEDEYLSEFGLAPNPTLLVTIELEAIASAA
ncbi:MAG: type II toxin-antitoxin system HicB family antitoxin [Planctomycetota bacterium]